MFFVDVRHSQTFLKNAICRTTLAILVVNSLSVHREQTEPCPLYLSPPTGRGSLDMARQSRPRSEVPEARAYLRLLTPVSLNQLEWREQEVSATTLKI